jgi:hypothetical protein
MAKAASALPRERTWPYTDYPDKAKRPECDSCGPFRGRLLRVVLSDKFGTQYRCRGCDDENEA